MTTNSLSKLMSLAKVVYHIYNIQFTGKLFFIQNPEDGFSRLKRWIMIGDHHQLPPVIKNMAFQKYSNMEQSLFTRFVRLGVPTVDLDAQGRARARLVSPAGSSTTLRL